MFSHSLKDIGTSCRHRVILYVRHAVSHIRRTAAMVRLCTYAAITRLGLNEPTLYLARIYLYIPYTCCIFDKYIYTKKKNYRPLFRISASSLWRTYLINNRSSQYVHGKGWCNSLPCIVRCTMTSDPISLLLHVLANLTYMDDLCKVNAIRPPTTCSYFGAPLGADAHS